MPLRKCEAPIRLLAKAENPSHFKGKREVLTAMESGQRGKLIVLEGIDQSGKKTQTKLLTRKLKEAHKSFETFTFPDYTTATGRAIKKLLRSGSASNPELIHLLYAVNRWEKKTELERQLTRREYVILDRYGQSNLVYGIAKGLPREWLINLERGLPEATLVIVLDVSPKTSFRRKEKLRDMHERNRQYLQRVQKIYRQEARRYGWFIVDGQGQDRAVAEKVWMIVSNLP